MAGIGKTTYAHLIFEDPLILRYSECRVFVSIGPTYQLRDILLNILAQVNPGNDISTEGDEKLADYLYESLRDRRYLVVLDDVWNTQVLDDLNRLFPDVNIGSRVLLTTRLEEVAKSCLFWNGLKRIFPDDIMGTVLKLITSLKNVAQNGLYGFHEINFLNKDESWCLLREKVFGEEESCPPNLEKAGKKIAENCEGLPLLIITVADILSKAEKTPEYWNKVAAKRNSVFTQAHDQMSKVLLPSYSNLPQHLKTYILYMGVFPQNHEITRSKLINLWIAEGIPGSYYFLNGCLDNLVSNSLVMVRQQSYNYRTKTCSLHSSFWHLCSREAGKNKFFHVLDSPVDGLARGIKTQRRLCIQNNVLFGIKDVYNSMASISSTARSLLCTGPDHKYPVPICLGLRLLRVLDALAICFYEFPMEVLKLVQLRYLALTYDGNIPPPISKLWNLEFLIVRQHLSIKSSGTPLYLPKEIWDMKALKHLQIMGSNLPEPPCGALLPSLSTLLEVNSHSCSKDVFEGLSQLWKLGIRIEMAPDEAELSRIFDHIFHLNNLRRLKCVVVNPKIRSEVVAPPAPLSIFPSTLRKLNLSGLGYPWEEMRVIASLPNLEVLKLRCYAFRGSKWEANDEGFPKLRFLLIEDSDIVQWTVKRGSFPSLQCLSFRHCYKLEEIPRILLLSLSRIEVVDCNPVIVTCAKQIKEEQLNLGNDILVVDLHSSWDDGNLKS